MSSLPDVVEKLMGGNVEGRLLALTVQQQMMGPGDDDMALLVRRGFS